MKTNEQALSELALDEIEFDGKGKFGHSKKKVWTRKQFEQLVNAIREGNDNAHIGELPPSTPGVASMGSWNAVREVVDWAVASMVGKFAMNCGVDLTPQWLIRFNSIEEAKTHLMEGWHVDAIVGKWDDKI